MEILLLHPGSLGDIILSLPAIALLRKQFSGARITIAGNMDHLASVMAGYAERMISLSTLPLHHLYAPAPLLEQDVHFWKSFDRIVSWTGSGHAEFIRKLREIRSDACVASWRPDSEEPRHVSRLFVDSLDLGIPLETGMMPAPIHISATLRNKGIQWLAARGWSSRDHLVAVHPGAGSKMKRWPLTNFVSLAQRWLDQGKTKLLIIEGPAESGLGDQMVRNLPPTNTILIESISLSLAAASLLQCRVFVGNDSGLAHLAAGLGIPSIVLFGPTLPQHWAPLGQHVVVLRDSRDCNACFGGQGKHTCLNNISVDKVMQNLKVAMD